VKPAIVKKSYTATSPASPLARTSVVLVVVRTPLVSEALSEGASAELAAHG
jgi:hypothetical protein